MISIRQERPEDVSFIRTVNEQAFGCPEEAQVVDALREACDDLLSLVAERDGQIVGHILFSPATVEAEQGVVHGMGLAPMAVLPGYQRQGIGSSLIRHGLALLRERGCPFVIVLGHPEYYPRFGFQLASKYGIISQWASIPDEAFMILVLDGSAMAGVSGVARYRDEFDDAM
ncbi:MAG: N-acetyltransferase [Gemmatimonadota bacterium]|nr:MAG: N-acetyltransferase [Gemmatimonadota bacterium]